MEEPGRLQSMGSLELDMTERLHFHFSLPCIGEGNGNPLQCSCLENPRDGGAWWAAVYGVAQSWTWLKWRSSSSNDNKIHKWYILYILPKIFEEHFKILYSVMMVDLHWRLRFRPLFCVHLFKSPGMDPSNNLFIILTLFFLIEVTLYYLNFRLCRTWIYPECRS